MCELRKIFLLIAILVLGARPALAWNEKGHMVVAAVAWQQLTAAQRKTVTALLKKHPAYEAEWKEGYDNLSADIPLGAYLMMRASAWPDDARSKKGLWAIYHRADWHYITYRIDFENGHDTTWADESTLTPNAVWVIDHCVRQMERADLRAATRAMYLAWLIHLVGDVHQPLHCGSLFNADYPGGDGGGNGFYVRKPTGGVDNLHSFWDNILGSPSESTVAAAAYKQGLNFWELSRNTATSNAVFVAGESARQWSLESFRHAADDVHLSGRLEGSRDEDDAPRLPAGYVDDAKRLARERCTLAGLRLGMCIAGVNHGGRSRDCADP